MCNECLLEVRPERGTVAQDVGSFLLNYKECAKCHVREWITIVDRNEEEIDDEEDDEEDYEQTVTYKHQCAKCEHFICEHYYRFGVNNAGVQEYMMECFLCGRGAYSWSPSDNDAKTSSETKTSENDEQSAAPVAVKLTAAIVIPQGHGQVNDEEDDEEWD